MYLHIGENDFRSSIHRPSVVASGISSLLDRLSSRVHAVCVSQLFSFPAAADRKHDVIQYNNELKSTFCHSDTVQFWRHRGGFWNQMVGSGNNFLIVEGYIGMKRDISCIGTVSGLQCQRAGRY